MEEKNEIQKEIEYIQKRFIKVFNRQVNLNNPQTINEKIQWIKLNERTPLRKQVADKLKVREYLQQLNLNQYCNSILWYGDDLNNIEWDSLPNKFVIKATHGCNMNLIVWNKFQFNVKDYITLFDTWLKTDYYDVGFEWVYKDLDKKIIIEPILLIDNKVPNDYRLWVMNGKVKLIEIEYDRIAFNYTNDFNINDYHKQNVRFFYTPTWEKLDIQHGNIPSSTEYIEKPFYLNSMINCAEIIGNDFSFIRVDFYALKDSFIIGELTNTPANGFGIFNPHHFEYLMGEWLKVGDYY